MGSLLPANTQTSQSSNTTHNSYDHKDPSQGPPIGYDNIKKKLSKEECQLVTIREFCDYTGIEPLEVEKYIDEKYLKW